MGGLWGLWGGLPVSFHQDPHLGLGGHSITQRPLRPLLSSPRARSEAGRRWATPAERAVPGEGAVSRRGPHCTQRLGQGPGRAWWGVGTLSGEEVSTRFPVSRGQEWGAGGGPPQGEGLTGLTSLLAATRSRSLKPHCPCVPASGARASAFVWLPKALRDRGGGGGGAGRGAAHRAPPRPGRSALLCQAAPRPPRMPSSGPAWPPGQESPTATPAVRFPGPVSGLRICPRSAAGC